MSLRPTDEDPAAVDERARYGLFVSGSQQSLLARIATATVADLPTGRDAVLIAGIGEITATATLNCWR